MKVTTPFGIASKLLTRTVLDFASSHNLPTYGMKRTEYGCRNVDGITIDNGEIYRKLEVYDSIGDTIATIHFDFILSKDGSNAHVCKITTTFPDHFTQNEIDHFIYEHKMWDSAIVTVSKPIPNEVELEYVGQVTQEVFEALKN